MSRLLEKISNILINHLKKSPVLQTLDVLMQEIEEKFERQPIDLNTLVSELSEGIDTKILDIQEKEKIGFIGGELAASYHNSKSKNILLELKLYFKDSQDKFILKEINKEIDKHILNEKSQQELFDSKVIEYEVDIPK